MNLVEQPVLARACWWNHIGCICCDPHWDRFVPVRLSYDEMQRFVSRYPDARLLRLDRRDDIEAVKITAIPFMPIRLPVYVTSYEFEYLSEIGEEE